MLWNLWQSVTSHSYDVINLLGYVLVWFYYASSVALGIYWLFTGLISIIMQFDLQGVDMYLATEDGYFFEFH